MTKPIVIETLDLDALHKDTKMIIGGKVYTRERLLSILKQHESRATLNKKYKKQARAKKKEQKTQQQPEVQEVQ